MDSNECGVITNAAGSYMNESKELTGRGERQSSFIVAMESATRFPCKGGRC